MIELKDISLTLNPKYEAGYFTRNTADMVTTSINDLNAAVRELQEKYRFVLDCNHARIEREVSEEKSYTLSELRSLYQKHLHTWTADTHAKDFISFLESQEGKES